MYKMFLCDALGALRKCLDLSNQRSDAIYVNPWLSSRRSGKIYNGSLNTQEFVRGRAAIKRVLVTLAINNATILKEEGFRGKTRHLELRYRNSNQSQ